MNTKFSKRVKDYFVSLLPIIKHPASYDVKWRNNDDLWSLALMGGMMLGLGIGEGILWLFILGVVITLVAILRLEKRIVCYQCKKNKGTINVCSLASGGAQVVCEKCYRKAGKCRSCGMNRLNCSC